MVSDLVDPEALLTTAIRAVVPEDTLVDLATDTDVARYQRAVLVTALPGTGPRNASPRLAQFYPVVLNVLARSRGDAKALTDLVWTAVMDLEQTTVPGIGTVVTVEADRLPARSPTNTVPNAVTFTQHNMQFTLRLRPV